MLKLMNINEIISTVKDLGSIRAAAKTLPYDRKTITKVWKQHEELQLLMYKNSNKAMEVYEQNITKRKYNVSNRKKIKLTETITNRIDEILESELEKSRNPKLRKQMLSYSDVHEILITEGYDIGLTTVGNYIRKMRDIHKETFIRQEYEPAQRAEYDFGEVTLCINGIQNVFHLAVMSLPYSNFKWAWLYKNQKQDVFFDSQIKFFNLVGGVPHEVVYDNMRNVVTKFIGKNEKQLNKKLIDFALYYDFKINVTNTYSGNEKGHVEGSVKHIRQKAFAKQYKFMSFEDAQERLKQTLIGINETASLTEEQKNFTPLKQNFDLAEMRHCNVNKYSVVRIENNFYSVPDIYTGKNVIAKIYLDNIKIINDSGSLIAEHKKIDGYEQYQLDLMHYLRTFTRKPNSLTNSKALKSQKCLYSIYNKYYHNQPKKFIEILNNNANLNIEQLNNFFEEMISSKKYLLEDVDIISSNANSVTQETRVNLKELNELYNLGGYDA